MINLDVMISTHLSAPMWEVCLAKTIKSFPTKLKQSPVTLYIDHSSYSGSAQELMEIIYRIKLLFYNGEFSNWRIQLSRLGVWGNVVNHLTTSASEYSLICEYDFMFTSSFSEINFELLIPTLKQENVDFLFFSRTTNSIEKFTVGLYEPRNVNGIDFIECKYYTNNTHIAKNKKFLSTIVDSGRELFKQQHFHPSVLEVDTIEQVKTRQDDFKCFYYGRINEGPFIHHLDGSRHYSNFDLYFNQIDHVDELRETINYSLADSVVVNNSYTEEQIEYIKQICHYNNMKYGTEFNEVLYI